MNQQISRSLPGQTPRRDGLTSSLGAGLWHKFCYVVQSNVFTHGFSMRREGLHNVPMSGPVLVIANHQSFLDPVAMGVAFPRRLIYLARKSLFRNPVFSWLIRSLNAVPIDQEGVGKEGLRTIIDQLGQGQAVLVFPEGERTFNGRMLALKPGIHLLIKRTRAPILPVGIAGAFDAWPRTRTLPIPAPLCWPANRGTIAVSIGEPIDSQRFLTGPREAALTALFHEIDVVQRRAEKLRRE